MTATLRLRCMRCGDMCDLDPFEMYGWGLCNRCWDRHPDIGMPWQRSFARAFHRWHDRWQKCGQKHPTWKALQAAWDSEEARVCSMLEPGVTNAPPF